MRRSRIHLIAGSMLLAAGLSLWHLASVDEQTAPEPVTAKTAAAAPPRSNAENLALRAELAHLRGRLDGMQSELRSRPGSPAEERAASEEPAREDRYRDLAPVERDLAIAEDLEAVMDAEPADDAWAAETETLAATAVADLESATLISVACRNTLCRAELTHTSNTKRDLAMSELTQVPPFNTQGFVHMRLSDPPESAIYFARAGHHLP